MGEMELTARNFPPGFYTGWLLPAAVVGVLVFMYGVFTMNSNTIAMETCDGVGLVWNLVWLIRDNLYGTFL